LHACAVQLELERGLAQIGQSFADVVRGSRQHGLYRPKELDIILGESWFAMFQKGACYGGDVSRQHYCAADALHWGAGCFCQSFHHHGFERALPEFSHQETHQELLFGLSGAREQLMQKLETLPLGAASRSRDDGLKGAIHVGDFEAGGFGRGASCVSQRGVADADTSLANAARQERHHDFDFLGVKFVEKARQEVYFSEALGGFRYAPGRLYYGRQQHVRRIAEMVWLLRAGAYCR
jgi:hypothetical protein